MEVSLLAVQVIVAAIGGLTPATRRCFKIDSHKLPHQMYHSPTHGKDKVPDALAIEIPGKTEHSDEAEGAQNE